MSFVCGQCAVGRCRDCTGLLNALADFCRCADRGHLPARSEEQQRIAAMNDEIYVRAIGSWFRREEQKAAVETM